MEVGDLHREVSCTALHCTALHCTALHCIALHCTVDTTEEALMAKLVWCTHIFELQKITIKCIIRTPEKMKLHCSALYNFLLV